VGQRRPPCVQHAGHANACAEALGISGDGRHGLGGRPEQQAVNGALVPEGDPGNLGW
jgi:hypothetical protein